MSNPAPRSRSAAIAGGRAWRSPVTAPTTTAPRRRRWSQPRTEASDEAAGDGAGPVLVRDTEVAPRPPFADGGESRHDEAEVDGGGIHARGERVFEDPPRTRLVPRDHPVLQSGHGLRPRPARSRPVTTARGRAQGVDVPARDAPLPPVPGGRQPPGPDVAVRRHVVQAGPLGGRGEGEVVGVLVVAHAASAHATTLLS